MVYVLWHSLLIDARSGNNVRYLVVGGMYTLFAVVWVLEYTIRPFCFYRSNVAIIYTYSRFHPLMDVLALSLCALLVLIVIMCSFYHFLDRLLFHPDFHHDSCDYYLHFLAILFILNYTFRLSVTKLFWFCKCATPWMFPSLNIRLEYWFEHVNFRLLYVMFTFPTRIFYRGVPGFVIDCHCGMWSRGLTTCLL